MVSLFEMTKKQLIAQIPTRGKAYSKKTLETYTKDILIGMLVMSKGNTVCPNLKDVTKKQLIAKIPTKDKSYSKKTLETYSKEKLIGMVVMAKGRVICLKEK